MLDLLTHAVVTAEAEVIKTEYSKDIECQTDSPQA